MALLITLFLVFTSRMVEGSNWILQKVYRPHGPLMCAETCRYSVIWSLVIRQYHCRVILASNTTNRRSLTDKDTFICVENHTETACSSPSTVKCRFDACVTGLKGAHTKHYRKLIGKRPDTALYVASKMGDLCIVQYILANQLIDINCKAKSGRTSVMIASRYKRTEVFNYLVSSGCDLNVKDHSNDSLLHAACKGGSTDIVKKLVVDLKMDLNVKGAYGWIPMHIAVKYGHIEVLELLRKLDSDLGVDAWTEGLHVACRFSNVNVVEYLLSLNISHIESRESETGCTPALAAAEQGNMKVLEFLIRKGSNLSAVNRDSNNILHAACLYGHLHIVKYIVSKELVPFDTRGFRGLTAAVLAVRTGHMDVVTFLEHRGFSLTDTDIEGFNTLHMACLSDSKGMVDYILGKKLFDKESKSVTGLTPLLLSASWGHKNICVLLVNKGCDVSAVDGIGDTPLHLACKGGYMNLVRFFVTLPGVDIRKKNGKGFSPLELAKQEGHSKLIRFIQQRIRGPVQ